MNKQDFHPSNVLKHCPYCGSVRFVWDGVKSFTCSDCNKRLFINAASAVAVIIENECGEILLTRRAHEPAKGALDLSGGFVDILECAEDAARREVKEELGLELDNLRYFVSFPNEYLFGGLIVYTLDMAFVATIDSTTIINVADDVAAVEWHPKNKLPFDEIAFDSIKNILKSYIQ